MESEVKMVVLRPRCFCLLPSVYRANHRTVKDIQRNPVSGEKKQIKGSWTTRNIHSGEEIRSWKDGYGFKNVLFLGLVWFSVLKQTAHDSISRRLNTFWIL